MCGRCLKYLLSLGMNGNFNLLKTRALLVYYQY